MKYLATINVPGYLPMDDEPPVFESAHAAWEYLADERVRSEDDAWELVECTCASAVVLTTHEDDCPIPDHDVYSATVNILQGLAEHLNWDDYVDDPITGEGVIYGDTPGYDGDHDLGLAYSVTELEDDDERAYPLGTTTRLDCGCLAHNTRMTQWGFHCDAEDQGYCNFEHSCGIDD